MYIPQHSFIQSSVAASFHTMELGYSSYCLLRHTLLQHPAVDVIVKWFTSTKHVSMTHLTSHFIV